MPGDRSIVGRQPDTFRQNSSGRRDLARLRADDAVGYTLPVADAPPPIYMVLPFVVMLLAIAILPLRVPHWWESNANKLIVSGALGAPILAAYLVRAPGALAPGGTINYTDPLTRSGTPSSSRSPAASDKGRAEWSSIFLLFSGPV